MARITLLLACLTPFGLGLLSAQNDETILFTVEDTPVSVSEFTYIYSKTNGQKADYSRESLEEYLDLYIKFKLKVQKARDLQLDTIKQLQNELAGYRRQLADSYLINREVTEKLVRQLWERNQTDVRISHLLFLAGPDATPSDTLAAFQKAQQAYQRLRRGTDFEVSAVEVSEDQSATENKGDLGFLSVPFPNGFDEVEAAAYSLEPGAFSKPVRSNLGYHIVKLVEKRPARGEIEAAHLLLRTKDKDPTAVKRLIDSLHQYLVEEDGDFTQLVRTYSEDDRTAPRGGYIGFFGINRFEEAFEEAAFSIPEDGAYSKPVQTSLGWHIIKRISLKAGEPYDMAKTRLEAMVKKDSRFEQARQALLQDIQKENGYMEFPKNLEAFTQTLNDTFLTFRWKPGAPNADAPLFQLGGETYTVGDYEDYLSRSTRDRLRLNRTLSPEEAAIDLFPAYLENELLRFEEKQLEEKYPEFKALMREYEEGIILFEVTKMKVWDKAAQDTAGLQAFFETIPGKYRWNERAEVSEYTVKYEDKDILTDLREYASDHRPKEVLEQFNTEEASKVYYEPKTLEKEKNPEAAAFIEWREGYMTTLKLSPKRDYYSFQKIEKILPAEDKTLNEARGYIIADYQDLLEKQWIEELKEEYEVKVNQSVFEDLIKKS